MSEVPLYGAQCTVYSMLRGLLRIPLEATGCTATSNSIGALVLGITLTSPLLAAPHLEIDIR